MHNLIYLEASVDNVKYDLLVDTGALHSFVSESLVKANNWVVSESAMSNVKLPNGDVMTSNLVVRLKVYYDDSRLFEVIKF